MIDSITWHYLITRFESPEAITPDEAFGLVAVIMREIEADQAMMMDGLLRIRRLIEHIP